jgi:hypothetical protein
MNPSSRGDAPGNEQAAMASARTGETAWIGTASLVAVLFGALTVWEGGAVLFWSEAAALLGWLGGFKRPPAQTFVMHGEPVSAAALARGIARRLRWDAQTPGTGPAFVIALEEAEGRPQ